MATRLEQLADDKVKLTVEVPAHDVHHAVEHAASDLAASVRIPGFRKGRVPMPLLVQRVGKDRIYTEAVESHIGGWFWNAATRARVNPVAQPEYEYSLPRSDKEDWRFSATVAVHPKPEPADWTKLEVPKAAVEVPQEAVQAELEELQRTVAELAPVQGRGAREDDVAVIDIAAEDGFAQRDLVVEVGAGRLVDEMDNAIRGLGVGQSREVAYEGVDQAPRRATVTVKEIHERVLPPLDDTVARAASEFDTLDDLRAQIEDNLRVQIEDEVEGQFRAAVVDELVRASKVNPEGPLVELRTRELLSGFVRTLESRGIDADSYFRLTGQSDSELVQRLHSEAAASVARELVLDAVADKLEIEVSDEEIRAELEEAGEDAPDIDAFIERGGADAVRDDLRLKRALDRVVAEVTPIAPELHEARETIWTPEKEQAAEAPKLWTPGSKE
jgi:trigger factor